MFCAILPDPSKNDKVKQGKNEEGQSFWSELFSKLRLFHLVTIVGLLLVIPNYVMGNMEEKFPLYVLIGLAFFAVSHIVYLLIFLPEKRRKRQEELERFRELSRKKGKGRKERSRRR